MEQVISGYCRMTDQSRLVEVEYTPGCPPEADCAWGHCLYQAQCTIGQAIARLQAGPEDEKRFPALDKRRGMCYPLVSYH